MQQKHEAENEDWREESLARVQADLPRYARPNQSYDATLFLNQQKFIWPYQTMNLNF